MNLGSQMHELCKELFPLCRSLTGNGVRETLKQLKQQFSNIEIYEVPTGTKCFDWEIPQEWNVNDAYVLDTNNEKIIDFKKNNLHLVGYSIPVNTELELGELQHHLHSLPNMPDAIPYVTSYYNDYWGFCITENQRNKLYDGVYRVLVDTEKKNGSMSYGEIILKGKTTKEIFLSTDICHPSMANNELSGPVVTTFLAKWLSTIDHYYTYRIIFIPETIGSIYYISKHLDQLKKNVIAGFVITCIGDDRTYSFVPSRYGNTLSDKIAKHILHHLYPEYKEYSFLDRGSDERQYCYPGVELPIASIMRSKYCEYPEYHTSLDNLEFVTPEGLFGGYTILKRTLEAIENNQIFNNILLCEPMLSKRKLYPNISTTDITSIVKRRWNILAYSDGNNDLIDIANIINVPVWNLYDEIKLLLSKSLISVNSRR